MMIWRKRDQHGSQSKRRPGGSPAGKGGPVDVAVLLHGLFATKRSMRKAEARLRSVGYVAINWGYPTFWRTIESHTRDLLPVLQDFQSRPEVRSINFLTHSMGGILARCAMSHSPLDKVKRIVMLAPPNSGSHLTRFPLGPFARCLPAITQLSEAPDSLPNRLGTPERVEVGIIAASSDCIVRTANTVLANQREHCVVQASHFELPTHDEAIAKAVHFLKEGTFTRAAVPALAAA